MGWVERCLSVILSVTVDTNSDAGLNGSDAPSR